MVHLKSVRWATAGKFRCEVTADDFETASKSVETTVVGKLLTNLPQLIFHSAVGFAYVISITTKAIF